MGVPARELPETQVLGPPERASPTYEDAAPDTDRKGFPIADEPLHNNASWRNDLETKWGKAASAGAAPMLLRGA